MYNDKFCVFIIFYEKGMKELYSHFSNVIIVNGDDLI